LGGVNGQVEKGKEMSLTTHLQEDATTTLHLPSNGDKGRAGAVKKLKREGGERKGRARQLSHSRRRRKDAAVLSL